MCVVKTVKCIPINLINSPRLSPDRGFFFAPTSLIREVAVVLEATQKVTNVGGYGLLGGFMPSHYEECERRSNPVRLVSVLNRPHPSPLL